MRVLFIILLFGLQTAFAQTKPDIVITGDVKKGDEHIPFAHVVLKNTTIGTTTDATGHYTIANAPIGTFTVKASALGYKSQEKVITLEADKSYELRFELEEDNINLNEIVVSGTRYEMDRREAPVMVNVIRDDIFRATQSVSIAEGLSFQPGLRLETNCQNCGFTQVRMNGLDGNYSQILINSRPIFSALQGVYGLEQIPANMVERIEIVRGGGSALYGGNAIAGTINIITKEPVINTWQLGSNFSLIDGVTPDHSLNGNVSLVSDDLKTGVTLYGMHRNRDHYDANGDGFSELTILENNTFGGRAFVKPDDQSRFTLDFHAISEFRRGGNLFERPAHLTDITEQLDHKIFGGGLTYERYNKDLDQKFAVYGSLQQTKRDSYYGGEGNQDNEEVYGGLSNEEILEKLNRAARFYGNTDDLAAVTGIQFTKMMNEFTITAGSEFTHNKVTDLMPGYQRLIDQQASNLGIYGQLEWALTNQLKLLGGLRFDHTNIDGNYNLLGDENKTSQNFSVLNPRFNVLYTPQPDLQLRLSYARGFRAPQAFDEDLHIETVGGGAQFVRLGENLEKEQSSAYTASMDWSRNIGGSQFNLLVEGFHTRLFNPFINVGILEGDQVSAPDVLEKRNAEEDVLVSGINLELRYAYGKLLKMQAGGTVQNAVYTNPVVIYDAADNEGNSITEERILRAPNVYNYLVASLYPKKDWQFDVSGNYTGSMAQPYEGPAGPLAIRNTPDFWELNTRLSYHFPIMKELHLEIGGGVQNIFNAYQDDFDRGIFRDAGYIYGPSRPRTYFISLKLENF
jgi:outer membrane receptor for ferrienterochelin and colicins